MKKMIIPALITLLSLQGSQISCADDNTALARFGSGSMAPGMKPSKAGVPVRTDNVALSKFGSGSMAPGVKAPKPKPSKVAQKSQDLLAQAQHILETQGVDALADWICQQAQAIVGKRSQPLTKASKPTVNRAAEMKMTGAFG